jgi:hypothetical protein
MIAFPAKGTPMFYLIIIIIIIIILAIVSFAMLKTSAFDPIKILTSKANVSSKPWGKFVTVGDKSHIENITDSGFSLQHNLDEIIIHGKPDAPIGIRRKDFVNGEMTTDKTLTLKSDYDLVLHEEGKDANVDIQIEFTTLPAGK